MNASIFSSPSMGVRSPSLYTKSIEFSISYYFSLPSYNSLLHLGQIIMNVPVYMDTGVTRVMNLSHDQLVGGSGLPALNLLFTLPLSELTLTDMTEPILYKEYL